MGGLRFVGAVQEAVGLCVDGLQPLNSEDVEGGYKAEEHDGKKRSCHTDGDGSFDTFSHNEQAPFLFILLMDGTGGRTHIICIRYYTVTCWNKQEKNFRPEERQILEIQTPPDSP